MQFIDLTLIKSINLIATLLTLNYIFFQIVIFKSNFPIQFQLIMINVLNIT